MTYLPNLIKRIDEFYKLAAPPYTTYTSPDEDEDVGDTDSGLYSMIVNKARDIETGNVRNDVLLIAELYKKALEMNAGFSTIEALNSDLLSNLNCDSDEEQDAVEELLLDVGKDVRNRARQSGTRDSEDVLRALQEVKNNFEDSEEPPEDEPKGLEKFDDRAKEVFDPTAGLSGERGDKSVNRGNRLITKRTPKDWLEVFKAEKEQAERDLNNPELNILKLQPGSQGREIERNSKEIRKNNLKELIVTLNNLSEITFKLLKVQDDIQKAPDDEQLKKLLPTLEEQEDALGKKRTLIKTRLRDHLQASKAQETQQKINESKNDPKAKKYFEELLALQNLKRDKGAGRSEEIFWRQKLVNALAAKDIHGDLTFQNLNPQTLSSLEAKIQEGTANKKTRQELSRQQTKQRSKLRGVEEVPLTKEQIIQKRLEGIKIKRKNFDFTKMQFDSLCEQYREKLATARTVAKQAVSHEMVQVEGKNKKYHNDLKPYLDRIAKAVDSKDSAALQKATQELNEQAKNFVHKSPVIKAYVWHTRYNKPLTDLKNQVNAISPLLEKQELDSNDLTTIDHVIKRGDAIIKHYSNNYPPSMGEAGSRLGPSLVNRRGWSFIYYDTSIKILKELVNQLKSIVGEVAVQ